MSEWPSAELKPPRPGRGRVVEVVWWLLFATAIVAILGGVWRSVEQIRHPTGFDRVGLMRGSSSTCVSAAPLTHLARVSWPEATDSYDACIVEVDGKAVNASVPRETVASWLDGPINSRVKVVLSDESHARAEAEFVRVPLVGWLALGVLVVDMLAACLYPAVALLLWRRRALDPVSRRISLALLLVAHVSKVTMAFWGGTQAHYLLAGIGALVVVVTLPAYPNGVYVPRVARWLRVLVPVGTFATLGTYFFAPAAALFFGFTMLGLLAAGLILLLVRYRRMPPGLEKQQVKWAAFGFSGGFLLMFIGLGIEAPVEMVTSNPGMFALLNGTADVIGELGFALIPAGVGVSLLEYRLNDADAAVGKSIGYAIVTVVIGVIWALVQSVVSDVAKRWAGDPMATTAITTVIAALVFTPARSYVLSWTEAKFQPALVQLRKLPEKLVRWQTCDTPEELAEATLADLVKGVGAAYAAVLGDDGRDWRLLAVKGIEPEKAMAHLAQPRPADRRADPFPVRLQLSEELGQPDLLAIGPRSDGATFTRDERSAIALIVDPLSSALQAAALRERHIRKVENSLLGIDQRLARVENELAPLAGEAASRLSPKGS